MQAIVIEVVTDSTSEVLQALLEKNMKEIMYGNRTKAVEDGSKIELHEQYIVGESFGLYDVIPFVLTFVSGVGTSLLAGWIYDKLKSCDKRAKIIINGLTIPIEDLEKLKVELTRIAEIMSPTEKNKK
ncbi:MAG: hypothetical protein J1E83_14600 [Lachnospiraceae bacterium]|nr:hypothetical protein [Lachnospiraceae bacterium]